MVAVLALGCLPALSLADSVQCGNRIITRGSSSAELAAFCGDPATVNKSSNYVGNGGRVRGANGTVPGVVEEVVVEIWTYNFGPDRLMQRVRIENGIVVQIDSMGYGYNEP